MQEAEAELRREGTYTFGGQWLAGWDTGFEFALSVVHGVCVRAGHFECGGKSRCGLKIKVLEY